MKWLTLFLICGIALVFDACQKHSLQELQQLEPAGSEKAADAKQGQVKGKPATDEAKR